MTSSWIYVKELIRLTATVAIRNDDRIIGYLITFGNSETGAQSDNG